MTDTPLRPRSITEIVDTAFTLYRRYFTQFVTITAITYAPFLLFSALRGATPSASIGSNLIMSLVTMLLAVLCFSMVGGAVNQLGSRVYLDGNADVEAALRATLPRLPSLIFSGLLLGVCVFIGLLCLLVGALYVAARFFAVTPVVALEGVNAMDAFSRSSVLSEGRKWSILGTLALVYGIYFLLSMGISVITVPAALAGHVLVSTLVSSVFTVVAYPLTGLVTMMLYYDARIRVEGFDVEHMSAQLGVAPDPLATGPLASPSR